MIAQQMTDNEVLEMAERIKTLEALASPSKDQLKLEATSAKALYMADLDLSNLKRGCTYRDSAFTQLLTKLHGTKYRVIHSPVELHFAELQQAVSNGSEIVTIDGASATAIVNGEIYSLLVKSSSEQRSDLKAIKQAIEDKAYVAQENAVAKLSVIMADKASAEASAAAYQDAVKQARQKYLNL